MSDRLQSCAALLVLLAVAPAAYAINPGDINGDLVVNSGDITLLLSYFGSQNLAGDANGDSVVNLFDFVSVGSHWGANYAPSGVAGVWTDVTPSNVNLVNSLSCGNFGVENVQADPSNPANIYAFFHCQGLWKSTDYGATWTGPINTGTNGATVSDCAGGIRLASNGAGVAPTLHLACIRGAAIGYWRSTNGGVSWTRYTIAPAQSNRQDVYPPAVDPYDSQHLIMAGHEQDLLVESVNGGQTWTNVPMNTGMLEGAGTGSISFVNTGTAATTRTTWLWMAQQSGSYGTWRTTNSGSSWTKVDKNEHPHGYAEIHQPNASGVVYMAGAYSDLGWGVMRSTNYGVTWSHVGMSGNQRVVYSTPQFVYSSYSYPTGLGASDGPSFQLAPQPGATGWTSPATPAAMKEGASQATVTYNGANYIIVTANYGSGLWRYVEPATTTSTNQTNQSNQTNQTNQTYSTNLTWSLCATAGNNCDVTGLRDIRLLTDAGTAGPYTTIQLYQSYIGCTQYAFQSLGITVPNAAYTHCDVSSLKTETLTNPMPMGGAPATWIVPRGDAGVSVPVIRTTGNPGTPTPDDGSFRTVCNPVGFGTYDPIVYPGQQNAGHLHLFFGNAGINPSSTVQTVAASGNSTCFGGILNRAAYWFPAMYNARTGKVLLPEPGTFYYKVGYNVNVSKIKPWPVGLRMIAGNKSATGPQDGPPNYAVGWACLRKDFGANLGTVPTDGTMPDCPVGALVRLIVQFPQCWDGVNLDSPDHQSHMAYLSFTSEPGKRSTCPASHPVEMAALTEFLTYEVLPGEDTKDWRLSSDMYSTSIRGGLSGHADWMNGWDPTTFNTIVTDCLNGQRDCGVGGIGNGEELYYQQKVYKMN